MLKERVLFVINLNSFHVYKKSDFFVCVFFFFCSFAVKRAKRLRISVLLVVVLLSFSHMMRD